MENKTSVIQTLSPRPLYVHVFQHKRMEWLLELIELDLSAWEKNSG